MSWDFDVIVVGAGPAGAAAAITLACLGRRILLIGARPADSQKIGESLPGAARPLLRELGVLDRFITDGHEPCFGNVACWGSDTPYIRDFIFDPHGQGWHLDRARFDRMLLQAALDAGANFRTDVRFHSSVRLPDGSTKILLDASKKELCSCAWLIDASGRAAAISRQLGASRQRIERLVATYAYFQTSDASDRRTWIEAEPDGWWYSATIPGSLRVAVYFTDADQIAASHCHDPKGFCDRLRLTRHISGLTRGQRLIAAPRTTDAASAVLAPAIGRGWCAVGDAAISFDPLSSQGILNALYTGLRAAEAVHDCLAGNPSLLMSYKSKLADILGAYMHNRSYFYSQERRWAERDFWRRRRDDPPSAPASVPPSALHSPNGWLRVPHLSPELEPPEGA